MGENKNDTVTQNPQFPFSNPLHFSFNFGSSDPPAAPLPPPPPCTEVFPSPEDQSPAKSKMEPIAIGDGLILLKGRVSTVNVFGVGNSDLVPGKYEGGLKLWEGSLDLVRILQSEVRDGRLSLRGKRVLELGCGHGLPGIFTGLEGATSVHFQDFNAEVLRCLTIPNVEANVAKMSAQTLLTNNNEMKTSPDVRFFAGDWSEVDRLLFHKSNDENQNVTVFSSAQEGCDGYDVILMAETVYALSSLPSLYGLIKKCLHRPNGVVYMSGKKHYFGVGGGTRQFVHLIGEDGIMEASLLTEVSNGSSNVREVWKFSFK